MTDLLTVTLAAIAFPNIDPVMLHLGPLKIHWYGVGYVVGILFGWWYAKRLLSTPRLWTGGKAPFSPELIDDLLTYAALGIVLGGRIGYVLFYNLPKYIANPVEILYLQDGGMSFHGGFIGCTLGMVLLARSRGVNVWTMFDVIAAGAPVAIGLVRIANFINSELWGAPTDLPWGVVFPNGGPEPRHPSQLYEALLEGLVLFLVLRLLTHPGLKLRRPGFIAGAFVAGYAIARMLVETVRVPDVQLGYLAGGWLTMGMVLSLPMLLVGIWLMATARPAPAPAASDDAPPG